MPIVKNVLTEQRQDTALEPINFKIKKILLDPLLKPDEQSYSSVMSLHHPTAKVESADQANVIVVEPINLKTKEIIQDPSSVLPPNMPAAERVAQRNNDILETETKDANPIKIEEQLVSIYKYLVLIIKSITSY